VRTARAAEELGYDSVWTGDHVVFPVESASAYPYHRGGAYSPDPLIAYDALIALAVVAGCTERVELGTGVLVLPQRNPLLLAKQLASIDSLSNGRLILGAGAGWLAEEFVALGAPDFALRSDVLEEWVAILRSCWTDDEPRFEGRHYRFDPIHFDPRPARPVPILIGGNSQAALRRAGRIGDGWFGTAVTLEEASASPHRRHSRPGCRAGARARRNRVRPRRASLRADARSGGAVARSCARDDRAVRGRGHARGPRLSRVV
jgi:probable F420-dependent oxidoreductase